MSRGTGASIVIAWLLLAATSRPADAAGSAAARPRVATIVVGTDAAPKPRDPALAAKGSALFDQATDAGTPRLGGANPLC